jgi:thiamine-phosphate pyrophosphorylase
MRLCAITDRKALVPNDEQAACQRLHALVAAWIEGGVDFIQVREKDLDPAGLLGLVKEILVGLERRQTRLLINHPSANEWLEMLVPVVDGVHLPGRLATGSVAAVREVFRRAGRGTIVSVACHHVHEIALAREEGADFVLFAPVFEKVLGEEGLREKARRAETPETERSREIALPAQGERRLRDLNSSATSERIAGVGLATLGDACHAAKSMPVYALGGVTRSNAAECLRVGAAGVAGIRLFAEDSWRELRSL